VEISKQSKFFDNTMLSSYKDCPRKYFIRHVLGWRSEGTAMPLVFGLSWHAGMDVVWQFANKLDHRTLADSAQAKFLETWEEQGLPSELDVQQLDNWSPRVPPTAHEMYHQYIEARWPVLREAELIACEQPFAVPLPRTTDVWYVGRLDKVVNYGSQKLVIEHKTTTEYKKDGGFKGDYIEGWYSDSQVKGYQFGGSMFFGGLDGVWVDSALVHKTVHNAFRFIPVAHKHDMLEEWLADTLEWVFRVGEDTNAFLDSEILAHGNFPKNEGSCYGKFGRCPYLDICRTVSDPSKLGGPPPGYIEEFWQPFDVLGLDKLIKAAA